MPADLRYAIRQLVRSPGFTLVAIAILALGIGVSTSIFSFTDHYLLPDLPYPDSRQLVRIFRTSPQSQQGGLPPAAFFDLRAARSFSGLAMSYADEESLFPSGPAGAPDTVNSLYVSADFLRILRIQPFLGRGFDSNSDQPGRPETLLLTYSYWRRHFGADPAVVGRTVRMGGPHPTAPMIIGILPPAFEQTPVWRHCDVVQNAVVWPEYASERDDDWVAVFGRLQPGVTLPTAQSELTVIARRLAHDFPPSNAATGFRVTDLAGSFEDASRFRMTLFVTLLAASVVLLACANLAGLQLVRGFGRRHEFAVRLALGAGRWALMAPLVLESGALAAAGGGLGIILSVWLNSFFGRFYEGDFAVALNPLAALYGLVCSLLAAVIFGVLPAWLATRAPTEAALRQAPRTSTEGRPHRRIRSSLIIGQLGLALTLVSAAATFAVAVQQTLRRALDSKPAGLFAGGLTPPDSTYKADAARFALIRRLRAQFAEIPGVRDLAITTQAPQIGYFDRQHLVVEGRSPDAPGQEPIARVATVDATFFRLLAVPVLAGRLFPDGLKPADPHAVVINAAMAQTLWPGQDAVGHRIKFAKASDWNEVIGVVGNFRVADWYDGRAPAWEVYRSVDQVVGWSYNVIIRPTLAPGALAAPFRKAVAATDPEIIVNGAGAVDDTFESLSNGRSLTVVTLSCFALIGVLIAMIGLYGVMAFMIQLRRRELGIRMALGAAPTSVLALVLREGAVLIGGGLGLGLLGVAVVDQFYRQTMTAMAFPGPVVQVGAAAALVASGLAACYFPARRAARTDPCVALREN